MAASKQKLSHEETEDELLDDTAFISTFLRQLPRFLKNAHSKRSYFEALYVPDERLKSRLKNYEDWVNKSPEAQEENAGELMEEIAFLAFSCLRGNDELKSGQSYAAQHDILVSGSNDIWMTIMDILHLKRTGRTILVEAKNTNQSVDDQQLSRLCYLLRYKFPIQSHLGVFFSRSGASGFPENETQQQRVLRDARSTQIIFHAATEDKFVVVLSHREIIRLNEKGALLFILEALIRDIEEGFGQVISFDQNWKENEVLPPHLLKYL